MPKADLNKAATIIMFLCLIFVIGIQVYTIHTWQKAHSECQQQLDRTHLMLRGAESFLNELLVERDALQEMLKERGVYLLGTFSTLEKETDDAED